MLLPQRFVEYYCISGAGVQDVDFPEVALEVAHFNNRTVLCGCVDYCSRKVSAAD